MRNLLVAFLAAFFALGAASAAEACPYSHDKKQTEASEDTKTS